MSVVHKCLIDRRA